MRPIRMIASMFIVGMVLPTLGETCFTNNVKWTYKVVNGEAFLGSGSSSTPAVPQTTTGALIIPEVLNGYPVRGVLDSAFYRCTSLTSVTIPNVVTNMGGWVFYGCTGLTSVTIPDSVTSIGQSAFYGCSSLTSMTIPDSVTSIGGTAFYGCGRLSSVVIPDSVISIGGSAFSYCRSLIDVTIPNSVTNIGYHMFYCCDGLTSVTMPKSVTSIGESAFSDCSGLVDVTILNGVTSIGDSAFSGCSKLMAVTIPDSVTHIGKSAFYGCNGLTSITIPDSVTRIGNLAFSCCSGLTDVTIGNGVTSIGDGAFDGCSGLNSVTILGSVMSIGPSTFSGCRKLTCVTMPDSVRRIGDSAFWGCSSLTSVSLPDGVTSIGFRAFSGCSGLMSVTIPNGIINIGAEAFENCRCLTGVSIPDGVTNIGDSTFSGCSGLTRVTMTNGVNNIGKRAFYGCSGLTSVTIPNTVTNIGYWAFSGCCGLTSVTMSDSVTNIGVYAFSDCTGLSSVTISSAVTNIPDSAFQSCSGLTSVTIPDSVQSVGESAFLGCSGLTSVTIPDSVTCIGGSAFSGCVGLENINIGNGVTNIMSQAFRKCIALTSVTIPDSVKEIGGSLFYECTSLTNVVIGNGVASIGDKYMFRGCDKISYDTTTIPGVKLFDGWVFGYTESLPDELNLVGIRGICPDAFYNCWNLKRVTIPNSAVYMGRGAFSGCYYIEEITLPFTGSRRNNPDESVARPFGHIFRDINNSGSGVYQPRDGGSPGENYPQAIYSPVPTPLRSVTITDPDGLGPAAFRSLRGITRVSIPDDTTKIEPFAFSGCASLESILIPSSVTNIANYAFDGCSSMREYVVAEGNPYYKSENGFLLTTDGKKILYAPLGQSVVEFPDGVTSVGPFFRHSLNLRNVAIPNSATNIEEYAFSGCTNLASVTIPYGVKSIGYDAFYKCVNLANVTIPESVTTLSGSTFQYCYALTNATDGIIFEGNAPSASSGVFPIGTTIRVFGWATGFDRSPWTNYAIHRVGIAYSVGDDGIRIGDGANCAFTNDMDVTSMRVPSAIDGIPVVAISDRAFYGLTNLVSITIPSSVKRIGKCAFGGCSNLVSVTFIGDAPEAEDIYVDDDGTYVPVTSHVSDSSTGWVSQGVSGIPEQWQGRPIIEEPTVTSGTIASSQTWARGRVYHVTGDLTVAKGAELTIEPGCIVKVAKGRAITVNGVLDARGTRSSPIVFTSITDDDYGGDTNGDGKNTVPQGGDWGTLVVSGVANFEYTTIQYGGSDVVRLNSNGTINFNNSEIAHATEYCVDLEGGAWSMRNSVFRDFYTAFRHWSTTFSCINSVFYDCSYISNNGGQSFVNCIFDRYSLGLCWWTDNSIYRNCTFWNPPEDTSSPQGCTHAGSNGNIWGDPMFVDPENGDFRVASDSPCVDAGDGTVAPKHDYYGQPRMDVKRVADAGIPDEDGICPDIGIYEATGVAAGVSPDLAVVSVTANRQGSPVDDLMSGVDVTVTYVVTNRGGMVATGTSRDTICFEGVDAALGGQIVEAALLDQVYHIETNASAVARTAQVRVPTLKAGNWRLRVTVNAERDIYEPLIVNNTHSSDETVLVTVDAFDVGGTYNFEVPPHDMSGVAVNGMPAAGGAIVSALPEGVTIYAAVGYVPDSERNDVTGLALADGRMALLIPAHEEGDTIYVTVVNESNARILVSLEALVSADGLELAKPADVEVTARGPNVEAHLELPSSVRSGRIYAAWIEYANTGDEDAELPIFTVSRTGGGAMFAASATGEYSEKPLTLVGLAPSSPRGKLKPGEAGRVMFYILSSGRLAVSLGMVSTASTSDLNGFSSVAEYQTGMSAAATRLCARGGTEPGFTEILAQALNERRGAGGAAVCGTVRNSVTKMPMPGVQMALVATNDLAVVDVVTTDAKGAFALSAHEAGDYAVEVQGVQENETLVYSLVDEDVTGVTIPVKPYCTVQGVALIGETAEPVAGVQVVIDDLRTEKPDDYETETDAAGMFRFPSLLDGEYALMVYPSEGWCMVTSGVFTVTNGATYAYNAVFSERGVMVEGSVADAETGNAVTNAAVMLTHAETGEAISVRTDSEGRFVFNGIAAGVYAVGLSHNEYQLQTMQTLEINRGDQGSVTLPLRARVKPVFTVMNPIGMVSHTAAFALLADVSSPEWDLDGDGVTDSTAAEPTWTYTAVGNYTVTLAYVDAAGIRRRSVAENAVEVIDQIENVLKDGNVVLTTDCGVYVESVTTNELVLVGSAAAGYRPGIVIGMKEGPLGGFIRKIVSVRQEGANRYVFDVEPGDLDDLYDAYFFTTDFGFDERQLSSALTKSSRRLLKASNDEIEHNFPIEVEISAYKPWTITMNGSASLYSDPVAGSQICYKTKDGKKVESYKVKNSYAVTMPITVAREIASTGRVLKKGKTPINWNGCAQVGVFGPWGLYFSIQCDYGIDGTASAEGAVSGEFTSRGVSTVEYRREDCGKEQPHIVERDFSDPEFKLASISGTVCAEVDAYVVIGVYVSWLKSLGRIGVGAKVGMTFGVEQDLAYNFADEDKKNGDLKSTFRLTSSLYGTIEASAKLLNVAQAKKYGADLPWKLKWAGELELGDMSVRTSGSGLTVNFESVNPKIEAKGFLLGKFDGIEVPSTGQIWSFGDMSFGTGKSTSHTYAQEGEYTVRLGATCAFPESFMSLSPFGKTFSTKVCVYKNQPPHPQLPIGGGKTDESFSMDPNEMAGPAGSGERRFVKPGDWMTYTVYFENKSDADVPAQEVRVTNSLSEWLDWGSFEMREVSFCNQVEVGLAGKQDDIVTVDQNGTECKVQISVALDTEEGKVEWYLRSIDPTRADYNYWPNDGEGLLPPNDDTHRGEGHITYRIKLREDAPANAVITNIASIVFDRNDPIETDPAWWNTVGSPGAAFAEIEVAVNEGETAAIRVNGGSADTASSVKVYLTYNAAAAADVDLKSAAVSDARDARPCQTNLKFPLTLTWEAGEVGEKVITIPTKIDKAVEDDEFFTLQLADAVGMELGDERVCTVTIRDMNDKTLKTTVTPYKPKKDETVATNSVTVASGNAKGGFIAGTGEYTSGSKLTLTAEARPGWAFQGWRLKDGDGTILSDKAKWQVVVTNDEEYVAVFEKIPYVRGLADPADGGKVAGSGLCATGKKVTLKASANKNFAFLGWRQGTGNGELGTGNGFVATTPSLVIDRGAKPTANSKTSTTITEIDGDVTYYAVFKSDPEIFVTVDATDGTGSEPTGKGSGKYVAGTITGMGKYAPGKTKIALKAAVNKGYVFAGWLDANGELLTKDATYTIASMGESDVEYTAKFVTADEDKGSIALAVNGEEMRLAGDGSPHQTNVWAGVYLEWPVTASALSEAKVKVAGLPSGLKFTDKPVTSKIGSGKTAVTITNVPANTIYGAPTAASKTAKDRETGALTVTPSTVKFTVTTAGKSTQTYQIDTVVDALPTWAQGTFAGGLFDGPLGDRALPCGTVSLTVDAKGKTSGKALGDGLTYTLAAPYYSGFALDENQSSNFLADVTATWSYKEGTKTVKTNDVVQLIVQDNGIGGYAVAEDWFEAYTVNWKVEPWKTLGKSFDKSILTYAILSDGTFSEDEDVLTSALSADVPARVTLKFAATGAVSVAGEFVTGYNEKTKKYTTMKATGSATLVPVDETHGVVFIYLTPKGLAPHARCVEVPWPEE